MGQYKLIKYLAFSFILLNLIVNPHVFAERRTSPYDPNKGPSQKSQDYYSDKPGNPYGNPSRGGQGDFFEQVPPELPSTSNLATPIPSIVPPVPVEFKPIDREDLQDIIAELANVLNSANGVKTSVNNCKMEGLSKIRFPVKCSNDSKTKEELYTGNACCEIQDDKGLGVGLITYNLCFNNFFCPIDVRFKHNINDQNAIKDCLNKSLNMIAGKDDDGKVFDSKIPVKNPPASRVVPIK